MSTEVMTEQPVFNNYQEALLFAYNYADQQFAKSLMTRMLTRTCSTRGLVGLDGAGEAGMIMASVMKLSQIERDVLCARYTKVKSFCKCCGHEVDTQQVKDALSRIELYVKNAKYSKDEKENDNIINIINISNLSMLRSIIYDYFGLDTYGTIKELASKFDVHRNTITKYSSNIKKMLRMIERQAENNICLLLEETGKVAVYE